MLEESGELFEVVDEDVEGPLTHGPFYLFQDPDVRGRWIAVRCVQAEAGALRRLAPLFSLISGLRPVAGSISDDQQRHHFLEVLQLRMRLGSEKGLGLGLVWIETSPAEGTELEEQARSVLRASDWMAVSETRLSIILDTPTRGALESLGQRLRAFPGGENRRLVGISWHPPGVTASELVARAESLLAGHPSTPLYLFPDSGE